jgi:Restriction endonuclease
MAALSADLLDRVRKTTPAFFERLIVDLLVAMGYGGTCAEAGRAIGQTGDDGVDGVIDLDTRVTPTRSSTTSGSSRAARSIPSSARRSCTSSSATF